MQAHQERVIAEKKNLDEKIDRLKLFNLNNPLFNTLPPEEQQRLSRQYEVMLEYSTILGARIEAFGG